MTKEADTGLTGRTVPPTNGKRSEVNVKPGTSLAELPQAPPEATPDPLGKFKDKAQVKLSARETAYDIFIIRNGTNRKGEKYAVLHGLYYSEIYKRLGYMGFYKRRPDAPDGEEHAAEPFFIRQAGAIIEPVDVAFIRDTFRKEWLEKKQAIKYEYGGSTFNFPTQILHEVFNRQQHLIFNSSSLQNLQTHTLPILKDTPEKSYFAFANGLFEVTEKGLQKADFKAIQGKAIWKGHLIQREFKEDTTEGHFEKFVKNVAGGEGQTDRYNAMRTAIGYLLHGYTSPAQAKAVILNDEKVSGKGKPDGGTGKGLYVNGLKQHRHTTKIDGKKFDPEDKFRWQNINRQTQIAWIDDVRTGFSFDVLHSTLTDGWNVERKRGHEFFIKPEDSPKVVIASNTVVSNQGTTNKRRQFILEFSDYYSKKIKTGTEEPIRDEHKCIFFSDDWTPADWNQFDTFMLDCVSFYLANGLLPYEHKNVAANQLIQATDEDFVTWLNGQDLKPGEEHDKKVLFEDFRNTYYGEDSKFQQRTFTGWLKLYGELKGWEINQRRSNNKNYIEYENR